MSDTSPKDQDALAASHRPTPVRHVGRTGEELWRVTRKGQTMICVLLNDSTAGAAWEVVLKDGDQWLVGRRYPDEAYARFIATGLLQDHLRDGWTQAR